MSAPATGVVLLASYPKSGNTWVRAILSALERPESLFDLNALGSGAQPFQLGASTPVLGLDPRWLTAAEAERLRDALLVDALRTGSGFLKTHERYRDRPAYWPDDEPDPPQPFPAVTAAVHVVRDPRDVAPSFARHWDLGIDHAIDRMAKDNRSAADPARQLGEQPWGSWSDHVRSWTQPSVPFPVHTVRYEDLRRDAVATLLPTLVASGLDIDAERLADAVERVRLDRLQDEEQRRGFRERVGTAAPFFGGGRGWREELTDEQVRTIEADHGDAMTALGYELVHGPDELAAARATLPAVREARAAARRHARTRWDVLPAHLGLRITEGEVPERLASGVSANPFVDVTPADVAPPVALVRLVGGNRLLVRDGTDVVVHVPDEERDSGDSGWLLQGWAVAIAMAQRGLLTLHGSSVDLCGSAVCIAGDSGAGKSTTALSMRRRGHRLLVDDVTTLDHGRRVLPYLRGVHLVPAAARRLGIDPDGLPALSSSRGKVTFFAEDPGPEPLPLRAIVVLRRSRDASRVVTEQVVGAARIAVLSTIADREGVAPAILGRDRWFALLAALADAVPVHVVSRPVGQWSLDDVLDAVEAAAQAHPVPGAPAVGVFGH
jgi:aryl sulfotransferase